MFTINIYKKLERLEFSIRDIKEKELDTALKRIEESILIHGKMWYKENPNILFRIEVIDQDELDIRNIIWETKQGFLEVCSIEKYIRHLINKETYQIWVKDHIDAESICKFAD